MDDYKKKEMLKIGDVAKLNQLSIDTLRFYDKIGLFTADWVDDNGYRYYFPKNMMKLDLIMWLRSMGTGLEEIREVLNNISLEHTQSILANREKELIEQIKKMQLQLQFCRRYSGYLKLAQYYQDGSGYFLSFSKRWCVFSDTPVPLKDRNAYEMKIKMLFQRYSDKFYYYNTLFGGRFRADGENSSDMLMYPATFNFSEVENVESICMEEGVYAVLPVYGYYDSAYQKIPDLLKFVHDNHYHPVSDCYVLKIWEEAEGEVGIEIMELQVRVEKD